MQCEGLKKVYRIDYGTYREKSVIHSIPEVALVVDTDAANIV